MNKKPQTNYCLLPHCLVHVAVTLEIESENETKYFVRNNKRKKRNSKKLINKHEKK